ncbi:MAG: hypothetical protein K0R16_622 [Nitrososphaeraceae archaeon]|nr:hypothetical protein [Nitrososphaeraceae archaeon]
MLLTRSKTRTTIKQESHVLLSGWKVSVHVQIQHISLLLLILFSKHPTRFLNKLRNIRI